LREAAVRGVAARGFTVPTEAVFEVFALVAMNFPLLFNSINNIYGLLH
jgi:hypothetical protein